MKRDMARTFAVVLVLAFASLQLSAQLMHPIGPTGGDVLSLGQDPTNPKRVFLGTADGHVFGSEDAGARWQLLGRTGSRNDSVVTAILVDPRDPHALFASTWTRDAIAGGGVYRSADGGRTWEAAGLAGQAVRALAMASGSPDTLVAGTLDGVYRTRDAGGSWQRISPVGDAELRNIDSIALDPANPDVIYAGTFHLPWKTADGGRTWHSIHSGMIDDSDVMSILVDRTQPGRVFASACSGIYRSDNGGELWQKVQGIPYASRRTLEILQDAKHPEIVFAATTEGLWKSPDAGSTWSRLTSEDWEIAAVALPSADSGRVLVGVEQRGVLVSDDGGQTFAPSNEGFFHRQVLALAADPDDSAHLLIALANAPESLMETTDGGGTWTPVGPGLSVADIRAIYGSSSPNGWWAALSSGGLASYDHSGSKPMWIQAGRVMSRQLAAGSHVPPRTTGLASASRPFDLSVNGMAFAGSDWFVATDRGLLISRDSGATWSPSTEGPMGKLPVQCVGVGPHGKPLWAASLRDIAESDDSGRTWTWHTLPREAGEVLQIDVTEDAASGAQVVLAGTRNGLYISRDSGYTWRATGFGLPQTPLRAIAVSESTFVASMKTGGLYISHDEGRSWILLTTGLIQGDFPALADPGGKAIIYAGSATDGAFAIGRTEPSGNSLAGQPQGPGTN